MIHIQLDTPAIIICLLTLVILLPQLHILFIFMIMDIYDFITNIRVFLNKF